MAQRKEISSGLVVTNPEKRTVTGLRRASWDFSDCPAEELGCCCYYEYAVESATTVRTILSYREAKPRLKSPADDVGNLVGTRMFGLSIRGLANDQDFPRKHWLEIDAKSRKRKTKKLPVHPELLCADPQASKYQGPQPTDFIRLKGEVERWNSICNESQALREQILRIRDPKRLRKLPKLFRQYLLKEEVKEWRKRFAKLAGVQLTRAANQLRLLCEKRYMKLRRGRQEPIVYEIDWTKRSDELVSEFHSWLHANRVHEPRRRTGGRPVNSITLLKALGAKRILDYYRRYGGRKVIPQAIALTSRTRAGAICPPLYRTAKGWKDAYRLATKHLNSLFSSIDT